MLATYSKGVLLESGILSFLIKCLICFFGDVIKYMINIHRG